jgi:hypothetical protein
MRLAASSTSWPGTATVARHGDVGLVLSVVVLAFQIRVSTVTVCCVRLKGGAECLPELKGEHMPRRRRRSRAGRSLGSFIVLVLTLLAVYRKDWTALAILWIFALVLWLAFFKRTQCDVETSSGEGCGNPARGRLRACHLVKHRRAKHDALWTMFRLKNPAIRYRVKWAQPRSSYGRVSPLPETPPARLM